MDADMTFQVHPFDSFSAVYENLIYAGFYKLLHKPKNKLKLISHEVYRVIAFLISIMYNVQHIIFIVQRRNDEDIMVESLLIMIPQLNLPTKFLALNLNSSRLDKLHDIMNAPIFAAKSKKDEELLLENKNEMHKLSKFVNFGITISAVFWTVSPFIKRVQDETTVVPSYFPFETNTWPRFILSVLLENGAVIWIGYGHIALDTVIATYYSQARNQLKIIKHNLEHFTDDCFNGVEDEVEERTFRYKDITNNRLQERLKHYIDRYDKVVWFTREVDSIFNNAMVFQFLTSSTVICATIYRMSTYTNVFSIPFMYLVLYVIMLQVQVLLYCYYGGLLKAESITMNDSLYLGDWVSLSPRFRRQLLVAMAQWSRPLTPHAAYLVPLSLNTFLTIIRAAYNFYTVLKSTT